MKKIVSRLGGSGQGLVEYALILILVAVVIGVLLFVWPGPQIWPVFTGGTAPAPLAPAFPLAGTPVIEESEIIEIVESGSVVELADTEVTTTNNCGSSNPTMVQTQRSRTIEHVVMLEGSGGVTIGDVDIASVPILAALKLSLEGKYGVQDKEIETRTYTISFSTGAYTFATHTLNWRYTWRQGQAVVRTADGSETVYTYRVRLSLEPETVSEERPCEDLTGVP